MQENQVQSLGREDPLEKGKQTYGYQEGKGVGKRWGLSSMLTTVYKIDN